MSATSARKSAGRRRSRFHKIHAATNPPTNTSHHKVVVFQPVKMRIKNNSSSAPAVAAQQNASRRRSRALAELRLQRAKLIFETRVPS